ncbi:hypothetical protein VTP01DRAFT_6400 [Rhizomucor pusillus]|uniref:uncharacterized protein n=1 Tax=Rhizomucor pusillus TaxID=4840 RepID=UPI00374375F8
MPSAVVSLKRALRKELNTLLQAVPGATIATESEAVVKQLFELEEWKTSKKISVYISMPNGEIDTRAIIEQLLLHSKDKTCYVPRCTKNVMDMVRLKSWEEYTSLPVNRWNIPEPPLDREMENALEKNGLDLILVPAMAFDEECNRIGHGKGYYDRYIRRCHEWAIKNNRNPPKTVGLALQKQILQVGKIPVEPTDQKIDRIITSSKIIPSL